MARCSRESSTSACPPAPSTQSSHALSLPPSHPPHATLCPPLTAAARRRLPDGTPWLRVERIKQAGSDTWADVGPGKWMAFDGGPGNGGKWLHETDETDED